MSKLPLLKIVEEYDELNQKLSLPGLATDDLIKLSKRKKKIGVQYGFATKIMSLTEAVNENKELLKEQDLDIELAELTKVDNQEKEAEIKELEERLLSELAPEDPNDAKNIILEIRAGAGGDESSIFAGDMLRMYSYLCDKLGFKIQVVSSSSNPIGGYKEVIAEIKGDYVHSWFKYEGGVHRVQRVPATEKQGRIHTSTVSVAVMPLIEGDSDFKLDMKEVEVIASTSQGAGGQSVNTTYSAIQVRHTPTGLEARSQDERNQIQNKIKALQVLTSRVYDHYEQIRLEKETSERRSQVGNADRSEKIRTYNFPQDRLTDHRYSKNWNQLPGILNGLIFDVIQEIKKIEAAMAIDKLNG